jgi:colicin import membrane protein
MTDRPMSDFMLSATLHAVVVGALLAFSYVAQQQVKNMPQVMELVAGEGDNFGAKVAPALGTPSGVKLDVPTPPAPKVEPVPLKPVEEPVAKPPEPVPAPPKPAAEPAKAATPPPAPNFAQQIRRKLIRAESKAKADVAKERKAEEKRLKEEEKRMSKAEFDKQNKASGQTKVARIDAEGIAKGVIGGSTANKVGGAGGKALTSDNEDLLGAYFALFKQRLKVAFEAPDGLSDTLEVVVRVTSNADGSLTNPRVVKSSGSAEFDRAVVAAIRKVTMPARPDHRSEPIDVPFSMRERDDR